MLFHLLPSNIASKFNVFRIVFASVGTRVSPIIPSIVFTIILFSLPANAQSPYNAHVIQPSLQLAANEAQTENLPAAVVWYLELAERGDKDAQYNLGSIYETGFGVNVDMKEAVKWYNKAALQGHQVSQLKLGML